MRLQQSIAPHFRQRESVKDIMKVLLIVCGVLLIPAIITCGLRAVVMALSGVLGAVAVEWAWRWFGNSDETISDLTAVTTGLMCSLIIPAECPVWAPLLTAAFAIGVVKLPFGGTGRSAFDPVTAGGCFAVMCWATFKNTFSGAKTTQLYQNLPERCFGYVQGKLPVFGNVDLSEAPISESVSPLALLSSGSQNVVSSSDAIAAVCDPSLTAGDFLLAGFNGPMGTTAIVLVVLCGVFAALFGACAWQTSLGFVAAIAVLSPIFSYAGLPFYMSPVYDLFTGATLFSAAFLAGNIMSAPHMSSARAMYGVCCGALTILLRRIGAVEGCEIFAVMLMNPAASAMDRMVWKARQKGFSFSKYMKKKMKKLKKALHISSGPFDSFDFDDDEEEDGNGFDV